LAYKLSLDLQALLNIKLLIIN